jgi:hypothetical protein
VGRGFALRYVDNGSLKLIACTELHCFLLGRFLRLRDLPPARVGPTSILGRGTDLRKVIIAIPFRCTACIRAAVQEHSPEGAGQRVRRLLIEAIGKLRAEEPLQVRAT